jgi:mannose/fructose/N-acetylgalactosamine-specific phosphotransferase system component IID
MAYVNEFGETIGCTILFADQVSNFFSSWYVTLLPLVSLVALFFIIKKYVNNKIVLIVYVVFALILYAWWLPKTFLMCA